MCAAFSINYLTKTLYPKERIAAVITSIFYLFNFFMLTILLNIGMLWTYISLPLLAALLIKITSQSQKTFTNILIFAVVFSITSSISSINMANVALILISLTAILIYQIITKRKKATEIFKKLLILSIITILVSLWWIIPIINYYILSPTQLQKEINVISWSWTHARSSFLNLFWLNGIWGWRPEYFPYYNQYMSNPILLFILFIPFNLAAAALLFKDRKQKLNLYFMLLILIFMFLAKGLHEPFSFINLALYNYIPYMNMFREPTSKFTLIMIPFLALLIGFSVSKIAKKLRINPISKLFIVSILLIFIISTYPLITNPVETKTEQIPYSTYVKIPNYWYEANEWLSNKTGDFRILITPLDDNYQVPYSWGYYGSDSFIERLIQKPVISPCYAYSYKINPNIIALIDHLRDTIKYNRTEEFETIISLLNVKYILQRNDIDYEYLASTHRDIINPDKMKTFLSSQPNIKLVKTIGKLDIYEYTKAEPYLHIFEPKNLDEYKIEITNKTILNLYWNFNSTNQLNEWKNTTLENQFGATCKLYIENQTLKFELWNSTWGWKTINSPLITAQYDAKYIFKLNIKAENAHEVHIKILEYDSNMNILHAESAYYVGDGTFNWKNIKIDYAPKEENITSLQLTIWNGHETNKPLPNKIWIDNVRIIGYVTRLNTTIIQTALETSKNNPPATILYYQKINPTKISVKINASKPFILAINEAYDPNWIAYLNGTTIHSISIFSVMNGFYINQTGYLEITIEYEPQRWFNLGCIISLTTLLACLTTLTITHIKQKRKQYQKRISPLNNPIQNKTQ